MKKSALQYSSTDLYYMNVSELSKPLVSALQVVLILPITSNSYFYTLIKSLRERLLLFATYVIPNGLHAS